MQPGGDFSAFYNCHPPPPPPPPHNLQNPNPNPNDLLPQSYASAPPISTYSSSSAASPYPSYPPFSQTPSPLPPSAPSFHHQPSFPPPPPPPSSASSDPPYPHLHPEPPSIPYYAYDHQSYPPPPNPTPAPFSYTPSHPYDTTTKFDRSGSAAGYLDENSSGYGYGRDRQPEFFERRYDPMGPRGDAIEDGVYAYDGGSVEPYGARGTGGFKSTTTTTPLSSSSSGWSGFDDYGRSVSFGKESGAAKIVRAVPKADVLQDAKSGVQKFRVKLLPEGGGQTTMDVLCQIGLDGIRMLDPNTNRTLRIYPLDTVTRWEAESSIYTFWSKSSVDIEPRRIRLQSNSYTTNTILDTVAAASVQLKEMGGNSVKGPVDSGEPFEQPAERKKGFADWMNLMRPGNEEKDHWVPDVAVTKCTSCGTDFGAFVRRHHCRNCGDIFCDKCTQGRIALTAEENAPVVRICDRCLAEVSLRLSNAKEATSKSAVQQSHEDLARKLQEEMDKNRKGSSGSRSSEGSSGRRMKEVACPTCTVHLQVQVPASGSERIECGVCQHPFLVSAH